MKSKPPRTTQSETLMIPCKPTTRGSILALLLGCIATLHAETPHAAKAPNILFIIADDLATRLGCYGDKSAITPNLDRLASEGIVFNRAYCQGAVCTASRTSFMLGLNSRHAKPSHFLKNPDTLTMGRWFREHGYQTCSIGKIDHDDPTDSYVDPKAWDIRVKRENLAPKAPIQRKSFDEDLGRMRKRVSNIGVADAPEAVADWVRTERLLEFFEKERDATKPFFAAIGFHAPHVPWDFTKTVYEAHNPAGFTVQEVPNNATPLPPGSLLQEPGMELTDAHQREGQRAYYAAVTMLDLQVGRILEHLRSKKLLEHTLVVFTSDHGYHLGWRRQWCKHSIDEEVLRVPLIVRHPQGAKGVAANGIVELLDLFPTFCAAVGQPIPEGLDGKSFAPLLQNPKSEGKVGAFCQWGNGRTVRTARWRLTERNDGTSELYDHHNDAGEYFNVIAHPEHTARVPELHALLDAEFGPQLKRTPGSPNAAQKTNAKVEK
jgi:arylsulfatase A-like enzyme